MKKIRYFGLILFSFLFFSAFVPSSSKLEVGMKAPLQNLKLKDVSGKLISLKDVNGENGLLVIFSSNSCPFALSWEDRFDEIYNLIKVRKIGMIIVNSNEGRREGDESFEEMKKHANQKKFKAPYAIDKDSKLADAFGAATNPHIFLFDKNLKLVYSGAIDDNYKSIKAADKHYLNDAINNLALGKTIQPNNTKALGCSIKRK